MMVGAWEILDHLSQSVFLKDRELRFVGANKAFCAELGRGTEDVIGRDDFALYPCQLAEKHRAEDRRVLADGRRIELDEQDLLDGHVRRVRVVKTPLKGPDGAIQGILGVAWDVTDAHRVDAQVRETHKAEAVAQLTRGVAHDFNGVLAAVLGNLALARHELNKPSGPAWQFVTEALDQAEFASQRAAALVRQLLSFSRPLQPPLEGLDVNALVRSALREFKSDKNPPLSIRVRLAPDLWRVQGDPAQLRQALANLCRHARSAIPDGRLRIETANQQVSIADLRRRRASRSEAAANLDARPGQFVRLRVRHTVDSVRPDLLTQIFKPVVTANEGQRQGLAVAVVTGIVRDHEGWMDCRTIRGKGTRFDVYLPRPVS